MQTTNDKPEVVLVLRHFTVGGLERVLLSHVRLLLTAGYEVTICLLDPGRDNALVAELPAAARLVIAPRNRLQRHFFLSELVRDRLVLLQFGDGRLYPSIRPALRSAQTVIRFCHSDYSHLRSAGKNLLDRVLARGEDRIVAVGGRSTRFLLEDVSVPEDKVTTLTNANEPRTGPTPAAPWYWAQEPYLVSIQSLYPHKGHNALITAFARVVAASPGVVRLVIVGDGDQTIPLKLLADELGITSRIVWLGAVWQQDIIDSVLAGATAFVSMSRFEGVPISVLEARQHGLPLVLTDIPGHRDGAGTTRAAFVAVDDCEQFATEVLKLLDDPTAASRERKADVEQLAADWQRYSDGFLAIIASGAAAAPYRAVDLGASRPNQV